jgi:hypothetical protein
MKLIETLTDEIKPVLAGHPASVQGAVLADLLAIWLAGHVIPSDDVETAKFREDLLQSHLAIVRKLIPVNAELIGTTP